MSLVRTAFNARKQIVTYAIFVVLASLDNAAAGVLPPLYAIISREFDANEAALGTVTALYVIVVALSATFWGYRGDQKRRKPLLIYGTLLWCTAMILTTFAVTYTQFLFFQLVTAVGVGSIASVGFSVISDVIPPARRGVALSLWSISQGTGGALGALLAGTAGAFDWRYPFWIISGLGFLFALLFLFTKEPRRGQSEPELAEVFEAGESYGYRISRQDLAFIWRLPTTRWLLIQSFFFAFAYGATLWIPRWAIARVEAEGYSLEMATIIGNIFVAMFSLGAFASIFMGYLGDRLQRRTLKGRALLAMSGLLLSIPFFTLLYFVPLRGIEIAPDAPFLEIVFTVLLSVFTNGWVILAFFAALGAVMFQAADPPNWAAMITDVNVPEHRGTVIGVSRIFRAVGNAISVSLAGWLIVTLSAPSPNNYVYTLALFQLLVIPAALCYLIVSRYIGSDIMAMRKTLRDRAAAHGGLSTPVVTSQNPQK